ncbi:MAG: hypothetical protein MHMPM18_003359 [Marteilia pararefringens]
MTVLWRLISHFKFISEITENGAESLKRPKSMVANHYSSWCYPWLLGMHAELRRSLYKPTVILAHCFTAATKEYQQGLCERVPVFLSCINPVKESYERHAKNERFIQKYCDHLGIRSNWPSEALLKKASESQSKHVRTKNDSGACSPFKMASPVRTLLKKFNSDKSDKPAKAVPQLTLTNLTEQADGGQSPTIAPADDHRLQKAPSSEANGDLRIRVQQNSYGNVPSDADGKSGVEIGLNLEEKAEEIEGQYEEPSMDETTASDYDQFPVVEVS